LELSERDVEDLEMVAPLIAFTPRRVRRFMTVYTVVRARLSIDAHESTAIAFATASLVGAPNTLGRELLSAKPIELTETIGEWLDRIGIRYENYAEAARVTEFLKESDSIRMLPLVEVLSLLPIVVRFASGMDGGETATA
jgi:hypothetical protein